MTRRRALHLAAAAIAAAVAVLTVSPVAAVARSVPPRSRVPVYAYFYQWFDTGSWNRAKIDYPLAGRYSSDDPHVLRNQVQMARGAGITGFLTSWKSTPTLNRRLDLLLTVAQDEHLDVGVVYEALDFQRRPLPFATVRHDILQLVGTYGPRMHDSRFGRPIVIWTGTDQYPTAEVAEVHRELAGRAYLLAAAKSAQAYARLASAVDGEAYYWSSGNPDATVTRQRLNDMSRVVHAHHGIWIAPAASGFDATTLGHSRVIPRAGGATLRQSLDNAYGSRPDAVGVISWNEWSENTYIEPGHRYGSEELDALRTYLRGRPAAPPGPSTAANDSSWSGLKAGFLLVGVCSVGLLFLTYRMGRPPKRRGRHGSRTVPDNGNEGDAETTGEGVAASPSGVGARPPARR